FPPLVVLRNQVARCDGGEAALRAQCKILQRYIQRGLVDSSPQFILGFQPRFLCRDQSEYDALVFWNHSQRLKTSCALGIVFQQVGVDVKMGEQPLGNSVVSSLGVPPALTVSTANMKSSGEIVRRNSCQAG